MRLQEIETRLAAIQTEVEKEDADLVALENEVNALTEERKQILEKIEQRKNLLGKVSAEGTVIKEFKGEDKMDEVRTYTRDSKEYRDAWLKMLQGKPLTDVEQRSVAATNVAGAIPTETYNQVIKKITEIAPLLNEITLLHVAGNVNFAVEGTVNAAAIHTENAEISSPAADTLVTVSLAGYEIVKLVRISATVTTMAIGDFENWLVGQLAEQVAYVIENWIINGTGTSQPKGIDYSNTWTDGTNAVDYTSTAPTYGEIIELVSYLKGGYARRAKFVMNHKTFWQQIQNLRDDGKYPIVSQENGGYRIMGFPVVFSDYVRDGDIFLGDLSKVVANLSQDIKVDKSAESGFAFNAIDYRGTAIFDCDISVAEAFVKGAATITAGA